MNSKIKFERWILFINNSKKIPYNELKDIFSKIYQALKKFLTAGKAGEGGMKLNDEGSYFPPIDTMNDIIKLMESIITECGGGDNFYYGIDCNGNNYYSAETNTYEMDGFKKPPDNEQMIEFFIKLCKLLVDIIIIMYHNINMWDNIFYFTKYIVYIKGRLLSWVQLISF